MYDEPKEDVMGIFGRSQVEKDTEALLRLSVQLFDATWDSAEPEWQPRFEKPDSLSIYHSFCLTTVPTACARLMRNCEVSLNKAGYWMLSLRLQDQERFYGGKIDPQEAANRTIVEQEFLNSWSKIIDIWFAGRGEVAVNMVARLVRFCETDEDAKEEDLERLLPLATWILARFKEAHEVFPKARNWK